MSFHVQVNTYSDRIGVWTGNAVNHETAEAAEEAAKALFQRWTAVRDWRVVQRHRGRETVVAQSTP